jgi:Bardet-Biedl syndrome 4 protein
LISKFLFNFLYSAKIDKSSIYILYLSVSPGNIEIFTDLGIMYLKINEADRAYEKLQESIAIEPKHTNSLLALGAILQTKNDPELALNTYKNIRHLADEGFEIWNNIGMCLYRKSKMIAVIFLFSSVCQTIFYLIVPFPQAISSLKKALWLCPMNFNVLYNLGVVLTTAQQYASAFQCFVSAVSVRPDSAESFMMLASELKLIFN